MSSLALWQLAVELGHARVASVAMALTAVAVLGVLVAPGPTVGWVGVDTIVIGVMYVAALAWFRRSPTSPRSLPAVAPEVNHRLRDPTGVRHPARADPRCGSRLRLR